jgi:hypothetical protein
MLVIYPEFFMPYQGGGASFWTIALAFVSGVALTGGGVGVFLATLLKKLK